MSASSTESPRSFRFPAGFLWGAATASHQVEGGNRWNDWWPLEEAGRLPYRSGDACRHYELYETDFDLAQSWSHNAHRFSIEWSRIEPIEGKWSGDAIEHYARVIASLRARAIEPIVTLHHFTNPQWFADQGGWTRAESVERFRRYAAFVAAELGSAVRYWVTINEPTVYAKRAFVAGDWPPCRPGSLALAAMAARNMVRAHISAYTAIHDRLPAAMIGIAHSAPFVTACDPRNIADRLCAGTRDYVLNDILFDFFKLRRHLDFIGINYYARQVVRWRPWGKSLIVGAECRENHHDEPRTFSRLGWEVYPAGLRHVLDKFSRFGLPIYVTENGIATDDEAERQEFLLRHLRILGECVNKGLDVRGYLYWSLIDNFEWAEGTNPRFGLASVDFASQVRVPRPAAWAFAAVCRSNSLPLGQ